MSEPDTTENENTPATSNGNKDVAERPYQRLVREITQVAKMQSGDMRWEILANSIDEIMEAGEDTDLILDSGSSGAPKKPDQYIGRPITVTNVGYLVSSEKFREGGVGVYAIFDSVTDDGEELRISTGAPMIVVKLRRLQTAGAIGWLDDEDGQKPGKRLKITAKDTGNGTLLDLAKV